MATREGEVSRSAASPKRKSSGSVTRHESELRLRRQLQHSNEKLDRSEQARIELEGRLKVSQDVLNHRDQMIHNVEVYSHQHFEEYQEHVNTEVEYMRPSLSNASNMPNEQSHALAEAYLNDEGSTMRIIELGRRGELAEQGTAHIIQESIAMRERCHSELEGAVRQIREQQEQSENAAAQLRQNGQQLHEACALYVNEREKANKEEMESLAATLERNSQELIVNNEMVMEHGRQAVALRDERAAEMQVAINELSESLVKKDEIIEQKNVRVKELNDRIAQNSDDASHKMMLRGWDIENMEFEMKQMREVSETEIAERDYKLERAEKDIAERKESAYVEKKLWIDRGMSLENAMDELKDENVNLMGMNSNLRSRIADQIQARARDDGSSLNRKVIEGLHAELRRANSGLKTLQENAGSNP